MLDFSKLIGRTVPSFFVLLMISGCGFFLPTPSHKEVVEINQEITNVELTERLLAIFAEQGISMCRGTPSLNNDLPDCSIPLWQGNLTRVDREKAIIEVGDFPAYATNTIGHSARFRRVSDSGLEITVKGVFAYYGPIPNDDVARRVAKIINVGLISAPAP